MSNSSEPPTVRADLPAERYTWMDAIEDVLDDDGRGTVGTGSPFAQAVPDDAFILTLGCGKYRIREHDFGTHLGLPRLMDMGQCNDAYGAIKIAGALSEAFDCSPSRRTRTCCAGPTG